MLTKCFYHTKTFVTLKQFNFEYDPKLNDIKLIKNANEYFKLKTIQIIYVVSLVNFFFLNYQIYYYSILYLKQFYER